MTITNWELMKIGFFIAFGWWIAATMSDALSFGFSVLAVIVHGVGGQPS